MANTTRLSLRSVSAFLALAGIPSFVVAQQTASWDHAECRPDRPATDAACTPVFQVSAEPGEKVALTILNTCPELFTYQVVSVPRRERGGSLESAGTPICDRQRVVEFTHEDQFGGYVVHVVGTAVELPRGDARITISVRTSEWRLGFSGGFTFNNLVDPVFELRPMMSRDGDGMGEEDQVSRFELLEREERQDDLGRSVVSLIHLHHSNWERLRWGWPAITFGLSLDPNDATEYYFGASWLFGDRAAISLGGVAGRVATPPAGFNVGDFVTDPNVLANVGHRRIVGWFIGLSYAFLGSGREDLRKPFLGADLPSSSPQGPAPPVPDNPPPGEETGGANAQEVSFSAEGETNIQVTPGDTTRLTVRLAAAGDGIPEQPVTWAIVPPVTEGVTLQSHDGTTKEDGRSTSLLIIPGDVTAGQRIFITATAGGIGSERSITFTISVGSPQ